MEDIELASLLRDPLAAEAAAKCGIELAELKTRPLEFFVEQHRDGTAAQAAEHYEKRRQLKLRMVREEHARLQQQASPMASQGDTRAVRMRRSQEQAMCAAVEQQARALQHEAEADARRQRMALRQAQAAANRDHQQLLRERTVQEQKRRRCVAYACPHTPASPPPLRCRRSKPTSKFCMIR